METREESLYRAIWVVKVFRVAPSSTFFAAIACSYTSGFREGPCDAEFGAAERRGRPEPGGPSLARGVLSALVNRYHHRRPRQRVRLMQRKRSQSLTRLVTPSSL
jgi:hypothetical protein